MSSPKNYELEQQDIIKRNIILDKLDKFDKEIRHNPGLPKHLYIIDNIAENYIARAIMLLATRCYDDVEENEDKKIQKKKWDKLVEIAGLSAAGIIQELKQEGLRQ